MPPEDLRWYTVVLPVFVLSHHCAAHTSVNCTSVPALVALFAPPKHKDGLALERSTMLLVQLKL